MASKEGEQSKVILTEEDMRSLVEGLQRIGEAAKGAARHIREWLDRKAE